MQITFDPMNPEECAKVAQLLGSTAPAPQPVETPTPAPQPVEAEEPDEDTSTPDAKGMMWRDDIHSTPPKKTAEGLWRAKRGQKDAYDAAYAALEAPAPQPTGGMPVPAPTPMPAAPAPTAPQPVVEYATMVEAFTAAMSAGKIADINAVYTDLKVAYDDLETNQTSIDRIYRYTQAVTGGASHADAVQAALT